MYLRTLKLEKQSLRDYWREENDFAEYERKKWWNENLPVQPYSIESKYEASDSMLDEEFEGG